MQMNDITRELNLQITGLGELGWHLKSGSNESAVLVRIAREAISKVIAVRVSDGDIVTGDIATMTVTLSIDNLAEAIKDALANVGDITGLAVGDLSVDLSP